MTTFKSIDEFKSEWQKCVSDLGGDVRANADQVTELGDHVTTLAGQFISAIPAGPYRNMTLQNLIGVGQLAVVGQSMARNIKAA